MGASAILGTLVTVASNDHVQRLAGGLAARAYSKLFGESGAPAADDGRADVPDLASLHAEIADRPTREEFVAAFALMQAEISSRQSLTMRLLVGALGVQAITLGLVVLLLSR